MKIKDTSMLAVALAGLVGAVVLVLSLRPRRHRRPHALWNGEDGSDPFADMVEEGAGLLAQWGDELADLRKRYA